MSKFCHGCGYAYDNCKCDAPKPTPSTPPKDIGEVAGDCKVTGGDWLPDESREGRFAPPWIVYDEDLQPEPFGGVYVYAPATDQFVCKITHVQPAGEPVPKAMQIANARRICEAINPRPPSATPSQSHSSTLIERVRVLEEALRWILHLHHGVSMDGSNLVTDAEWSEAISKGMDALSFNTEAAE